MITELIIRKKGTEASRGTKAQTCGCKCDRLWLRFPLEEIKYFVFSFRHSAINASGIQRRVGNISVLMNNWNFLSSIV